MECITIVVLYFFSNKKHKYTELLLMSNIKFTKVQFTILGLLLALCPSIGNIFYSINLSLFYLLPYLWWNIRHRSLCKHEDTFSEQICLPVFWMSVFLCGQLSQFQFYLTSCVCTWERKSHAKPLGGELCLMNHNKCLASERFPYQG